MMRRQAGFTLMEVLIASALVSMVLALAMRGFSEVNKVSNLSKSKMSVREEAAKGVQEVGRQLKRANIMYFTVRPLGIIDNLAKVTNAQAHNFGANLQLAVPSYFRNNSPMAARGKVYYGGPGRLAPNPNVFGPAYEVDRFRFPIHDPSSTDYLQATQRLMSNDPAYAGNDRFFPSPLAYWAVATFYDYTTSSTIREAMLPRSWDFYLLYLAPMKLSRNDAGLSYAGAGYRPDMAGPAGSQWARSTVPFELRLMRVPGVLAARTGFTPETDPGDTASQHILGVPFDYQSARVNYDPVAIPMSADAAQTAAHFLVSTYRWQNGGGGISTRVGSGARVRNGNNANAFHPNFNNLGNDPPSQDALAQARDPNAGAVTDKVLAQYIDPDSVDGTCVRFVNNIDPTPGTAPNAAYRRYLNAYVGAPALGYGYLYNTYRDSVAPASWDPVGSAPVPRRALISVTTRYRNDRRLPFQFATERLEIDLEGVVNYQSQDRRSR